MLVSCKMSWNLEFSYNRPMFVVNHIHIHDAHTHTHTHTNTDAAHKHNHNIIADNNQERLQFLRSQSQPDPHTKGESETALVKRSASEPYPATGIHIHMNTSIYYNIPVPCVLYKTMIMYTIHYYTRLYYPLIQRCLMCLAILSWLRWQGKFWPNSQAGRFLCAP